MISLNKKGQALVEFVLILPIIIMILFMIIDFGIIFNTKINIENYMDDIIIMLDNKENINIIKEKYNDVDIEVNNYNEKYNKIVIKRKVNVMTPGLDRILGDPYEVRVERIVSNE